MADVLEKARAWEESVVVEAVDAEEEDVRILREEVVGTVSMVHVPIHDGHALQAMPALQVPGCYSHVVEEAKAGGAVARGMVAGRSHDSHACANRRGRVEGGVHEAQKAAHREPRTAGRVLADVGVRPEGEAEGLCLLVAGGLVAQHPLHVPCVVDKQELLLRGFARGHLRAGTDEARRMQLCQDLLGACWPLRVAGWAAVEMHRLVKSKANLAILAVKEATGPGPLLGHLDAQEGGWRRLAGARASTGHCQRRCNPWLGTYTCCFACAR
mmetsp:Transcript_58624/g.188497  ORF Transcript_58624/g.188497 Transcript_58624/m.188497 type:complete len:270 (-) Transcript_58624:211-1020(-)